MSQNGFDVLLKMIQETNSHVTELIKITAQNQTAIRLVVTVGVVFFGGLLAFYFRTIGGQ